MSPARLWRSRGASRACGHAGVMIDRDALNGLAERQAAVLSRAQLLRYGRHRGRHRLEGHLQAVAPPAPGGLPHLPRPPGLGRDGVGGAARGRPRRGPVPRERRLLARPADGRPGRRRPARPHQREVAPRPGLRVHRCRTTRCGSTPAPLCVPRTRLPDTVSTWRPSARSAPGRPRPRHRRLPTPADRRGRAAHRALGPARAPVETVLREALADASGGAESVLEAQWVRRVVRPHGLPEGVPSSSGTAAGGATTGRTPTCGSSSSCRAWRSTVRPGRWSATGDVCASRRPTGGSRSRSSGPTSTSPRAPRRSSWRSCCAGTAGSGGHDGAARRAARPRSSARERDRPHPDQGDPAHGDREGVGAPTAPTPLPGPSRSLAPTAGQTADVGHCRPLRDVSASRRATRHDVLQRRDAPQQIRAGIRRDGGSRAGAGPTRGR